MTTRIDFIREVRDAANSASEITGMSAELMIAQAVQETGWGQKVLSGTNNIYNIKADSSWTGPKATFSVKEFIGGQWVTVDADFRVYETVQESLIDRVNFLQDNPRYSEIFNEERNAPFLQTTN
jgi:flagellum-specific peptidoglycan hydrolase FlgJ